MVDLHTNGTNLFNNYEISQLAEGGLTKITFSIAHLDSDVNKKLMGVMQDTEMMIKTANTYGLLTRVSLVLTKSGISTFEEVVRFIREVGEMGAHMVVVRELWIPNLVNPANKEILKWCEENFISVESIEKKFFNTTHEYHMGSVSELGQFITKENSLGLIVGEPLPWGPPVYGMEGKFRDQNHGVNITFARCDQNSKGPVLKSIVHRPNGHGYVNWDSNCFILY